MRGPVELVALITLDAAEELGVDAGVRVAVRVKATALHAFPAGRMKTPAGSLRARPESG